MLFLELTFHDFLSFAGENTISFPNPLTHETSLVLVLGPNNAGKTNVIRALRFLLYGDLLGHGNAEHRLIHDDVRKRDGSKVVEGWVQATVLIHGEPVTFRRRIKASLDDQGGTEWVSVVLEKIKGEGTNRISQEDETGVLAGILRRMVPESLFDYFYFQGEELARQLLRGARGSRIREGLETLLHENSWREAVKTVESVRKDISRRMRQLDGVSEQEKELRRQYEACRAYMPRLKKEAERQKSTLEQAEAAYNSAEEMILELSRRTSSEVTVQDLQKAHRRLARSEHEIKALENDIGTLVCDSRGIPFLHDAFTRVSGLLDEWKRERAAMPDPPSRAFVEKLLSQQKCVCGRTLDPGQDAEAREQLRRCPDSMGVQPGDRELARLADWIANLDGGVKGTIQNTQARLRDALKRRAACLQRHEELQAKALCLEDELRKSKHEEIAELQSMQRQAGKLRLKAQRQLDEAKKKLDQMLAKQRKKGEELRTYESRGTSKQHAKLTALLRRAEELEELIEEAFEMLKSSFSSVLQDAVSRHYDPVVTDGTRAYIHKNSLLPSVIIDGVPQHNIGGGQRQLLVLAHIISLSELRQRLHEELYELGIRPGRLGDQSFFLDSVFAPADDVYARDIATFLPGKARQVLLLVASQQWHDAVRKPIEPAVDRAYRFLLHTPNPDRNEAEYNTEFRGNKLSLVRVVNRQEGPHTLIEELDE